MKRFDVFVQAEAEASGENPEAIRAHLRASLHDKPAAWLEYLDEELDEVQAAKLRYGWRDALKTLKQYAERDPQGFEEMLAQEGVSKIDLIKESSRFATFKFMAERANDLTARPPVTVDRAFFQRSGEFWWEHSFKHSLNVHEAFRHALRYVEERRPLEPEWAEQTALLFQTEEGSALMLSSARWAHFGFPLVQFSSHRYVAALLSTASPTDIPIKPPWPSFLIEIPSGLLSTSAKEDHDRQDLAYIMVEQHDITRDGAVVDGWFLAAYTRQGVTLHRNRLTLDEMRAGEPPDGEDRWNAFTAELNDRDDRTLFLLSRLVLNTCVAMSDPTTVKRMGAHPKSEPVGPRRTPGREPECRVFRVGKPITVDCRPAVENYVNGVKRNPLSLQFLVRGHWRQQACGPKLTERRPTWIEPYWKGPEEAPINMRAHKLGAHG